MTAAEMVAEALASSSTPDRGACRSCECEQTTEAGDVGSYCCCCETWRARMDAALAHLAELASRAEERAARAEARADKLRGVLGDVKKRTVFAAFGSDLQSVFVKTLMALDEDDKAAQAAKGVG